MQRSNEFAVVLRNPGCRGVFFHVGLVRVVYYNLDFGLALAAGLVGVNHGVVAAVVAVHILERNFAVGGLELVRAAPAPDFAVPRVRAKGHVRAFLDRQISRLAPFAVANFHIRDNLRAAARGHDLLAIAHADRIGNVNDARLEILGGEGLHEFSRLFGGNGEYGTVAGRKGSARLGVLHELEVFEVAAGGELVMPVVVAVVHQYPDVLVDEFEHACSFDRFGRLLQSFARLAPLRTGGLSACRHERIRSHLADASVALVLVECVVLLVDGVVDDIHVDSRLAAVKEMRRFTFQIGKVPVCIGVEHFVIADGAVVGQEREIHERAALGAVAVVVGVIPERLGGPYAGHVREVLALVLVGEMDSAVFPVDKVAGAHEYHATVARPAFGALHVGVHHVKPAIGRTQYVRVAQPLLDAHRIGSYHAVPVIHGGKVVAVVAQRVVNVLVIVRREVGEQVVGVRLKPVDRDLELVDLCLRTPDDVVVQGACESHFVVFAYQSPVDTAIVPQKECIGAFPGDVELLAGGGYRVGEVEVIVEVVDARGLHFSERLP